MPCERPRADKAPGMKKRTHTAYLVVRCGLMVFTMRPGLMVVTFVRVISERHAGNAKVAHFYFSGNVKKNVFASQIPVQDPEAVHVAHAI